MPDPPLWTVVGASVRGADHALDGTECQDAHAAAVEGEWVVAAVCDGAGSTALGALGAAVGSRAVVGALEGACREAPDGPPAGAEAYWRRAAHDAVFAARRAVERALEDAPGGTDERGVARFERAHATLVAAVARPSGGLFVHVGDGAGFALEGGATRATSRPANGAFANETFFFTQSDWDGHLRLTPFGPADRVVLLSDGGAAVATQGGELFAGFAEPVGRYLEGATVEDGREALAQTLGDALTDAVTGDDKTVVWVHRADRHGRLEPAGGGPADGP